MKRLSILAVTVIFSTVLQFSACGSSNDSSGGSSVGSPEDCKALCDKASQCKKMSDKDKQDCLDACQKTAKVTRSSCWDVLVSCTKDASCEDSKSDSCWIQAAKSQPNSVIEPLFTTICTKAHECKSSVDIEECKKELLNKADSDLAMVKTIIDSTLNCIGNCINSKTCNEIGSSSDPVEDFGNFFGDCACSCGVAIACE